MEKKRWDLICIGRAGVDLYGEQTGGRLEDMSSFAKYVGGSPANTAIGAARLGLRPAMLTRVGNEHLGRFIRETMDAEGVDTEPLITDLHRLTALAILGIQSEHQLPLIFYRENCADMALCAADIVPEQIAQTHAILVSGTHFSTAGVAAASHQAMKLARAQGARVILDIDYRPNLWNLAGHGEGESRFIADQGVSRHLQQYLADCDLIVGTEEEFQIAGGVEDSLAALSQVRALSAAVLVCKRGALGCCVFAADVDDWDSAIAVAGYPVTVFNLLGAGDAFMAGLLRGWLRGEDWHTSCTYANACGALAVSRHGCAPALPSELELQHFIQKGSEYQALRFDPFLNHLHRTTNRRKYYHRLVVFAFDHRHQFRSWLDAGGHRDQDASDFKCLIWQAAEAEAGTDSGFGVLVDDQFGQAALQAATASGAWVGRPLEVAGLFPLRLDIEGEIAEHLASWPRTQTVKVLCPYRLDDDEQTRARHERLIQRIDHACRYTGHEWLLEIITARDDQGPALDTVSTIMAHFYKLGVKPDWWKLEPGKSAAYWNAAGAVIDTYDRECQGIIILGFDGTIESITDTFKVAAGQPRVKGFAVGRALFAQVARDWFAKTIDDATAITMMRTNYRCMITAWDMVCVDQQRSLTATRIQ